MKGFNQLDYGAIISVSQKHYSASEQIGSNDAARFKI